MKKTFEFRGKRISLFVYEGKNRIEYVKVPSVVVIIPLIEKNKVILVKQYRHAIKNYLWELPAGKIEKNENVKNAAKRELMEETGYDGKIRKIGSFYVSPGFSNEIYHFFLATNLKKIYGYDRKEIKEVKIFGIKYLKKSKDLKTAFAYYILKEIPLRL